MRTKHAPAVRMSLAEYFELPTDEERAELIFGECVGSPRPSEEHNDFVHDLGELLKRWTRHHGLGKVAIETDMVLDEPNDLAYAPDLLFVATANNARRRKGRIYGPADLCVEVLSPSERPWLRHRKFADYEQYGVGWYWIIDTEEPRLEEYQLRGDSYVPRSEVFGADWFSPGLFAGLHLRLPPLLLGDLKAAVKGKAKRLM